MSENERNESSDDDSDIDMHNNVDSPPDYYSLDETQASVERTLTDHLNKVLLSSFLNRLNQTSVEPTTERIDTNENDVDQEENK